MMCTYRMLFVRIFVYDIFYNYFTKSDYAYIQSFSSSTPKKGGWNV